MCGVRELPQLLGLHRDGGAVGDQLGQECGEVGGVWWMMWRVLSLTCGAPAMFF